MNKILKKDLSYIIIGEEFTKEGIRHGQGFVAWKKEVSWTENQNRLGESGIVHTGKMYRKSTPQANADYCKKDHVILREEGKMPVQGERTDFQLMRDLIDGGAGMGEIIGEATSGQSVRSAELILKYRDTKRAVCSVECIWVFGGGVDDAERGALADILCEDDSEIYECANDKWWEGYDAEEVVRFENVEPGAFTTPRILKLTGKRPFRVEQKGGSRQVKYRKIVFTSEKHPIEIVHQDLLDRFRIYDAGLKIREEVGGNNKAPTKSDIEEWQERMRCTCG